MPCRHPASKQESPLPLTDRCDAEAQRTLNIPYWVIKPFLLLGLAVEYSLDGGCNQELSYDHQKLMTHTDELSDSA